MSIQPLNKFQQDYLATWTEPDPTLRRHAIDRIWAPGGRLVMSSPGITVEGVNDIAAHITQVHDDLIADKHLIFTYDQAVEAGDALLLRWSMLTPTGDVAGRGADVVFRDTDGRATTAYMFMGIT